jgi:hypothetical protein
MEVVFYKERGMELPTVVFNGDTFYEFVRIDPNIFEYVATNEKAVKFLTKMGYPPREAAPVETPPPSKVVERKAAIQAAQE